MSLCTLSGTAKQPESLCQPLLQSQNFHVSTAGYNPGNAAHNSARTTARAVSVPSTAAAVLAVVCTSVRAVSRATSRAESPWM